MKFSLAGEVDKDILGEIDDLFEELLARGLSSLVLDLSAATYIDYRELGTLVRRARRCRQFGGDLRLAGLSPYLATVFQSAGQHQEFEVYASMDAALASFETPVGLFG